MKKHNTFLLFFLITLSFFGQNKNNNHQKIYAAKVSFITNQISLSREQAQNFWPVYNKSRKEYFELYKEKKILIKSINFDTIDNKNSEALFNKFDSLENKINAKRKANDSLLLTIVNHTQFLKLKLAEIKFKRKLLEQIKSKETSK